MRRSRALIAVGATVSVAAVVVALVKARLDWHVETGTPVWSSDGPAKAKNRGPRPADLAFLGDVRDDSGAPIIGAVVVVEGDQGDLARVITDTDGLFSVTVTPAARILRFSAVGFVDSDVSASVLPMEPQGEVFWSQLLVRDPNVRVVNVTSRGQPVAGARAYGVLTNSEGAERLTDGPLSDAAGRLVFGAQRGDSSVVVAHTAHGAVRVARDAGTVTLPASATFTVTVTDHDGGGPLEGARVLVRPRVVGDDLLATALRRAWRSVTATESDAQGRVSWQAMAGDATVDVAHPGFRPVRMQEVVIADGRGIAISLERSVVVRGVVTDAVTGAPVGGARVRGDIAGRVGGTTTTDDLGHFELSEWEARPSSLSVALRGYRTLTVGNISGHASRVDDLALQLVPGDGDDVVGIGVQVGRPAPGARGVVVVAVEQGSPAAAAGLAKGDLITAVDDEKLEDNLDAVVGAIRGAQGERVRLTYERDGVTHYVDVVRARITVNARTR